MNSKNEAVNGYDDIRINTKIKLSALWASLTFCYLYGDYFELYVPQKTQEIVNGTTLLDSPMKLFGASILLIIPALMVCLSIFLKRGINRKLNMAFGIFYSIIMLLIAIESLTPWRSFYVFYALVESSITAVIFYIALKWKSN